MAYISEGEHISTPVAIADVQRCLGVGSGDLGTLCMSQYINMWSVSKPVYFPKVAQLTDADLKTGRTISGYTTSYGIKKRASTAWSDYVNTSTGAVKSEPWQYDRAVADGVNVFRLTDFYNYWHTARCAMTLTLDGKDKVVVPASVSGSGDILHYMINFLYMLYSYGCISAQQLFGACLTYHPSVILTCYRDSHMWHYVKSSSLTMAEIGAGSTQSGADINIDTADLRAAMIHDNGGSSYGVPRCLDNGTQWEACMVLISGNAIAGSETEHTVKDSGRTIVRLEYLEGLDRNTFTLVSGKFSYISAMSIAVTLKKDSTTNWYYIDELTVTATKVTTASMAFTVKGMLSCQIGMVSVSGVAIDQQSVTVENYASTTFAAQSGSVTNTLQIPRTTYKPERDADPSGSRFCTGYLIFKNQYGDWSGTFTIDVKTGSPQYYRTVNLQ